MGFDNPQISWRELERRLSGRPSPDPTFDGGDSPAWSRKRDEYEPLGLPRIESRTPYAELHAHSSFSFLDGASSPEELAEEAARLGLASLTLTDHDGVYGVVRFAEAAEKIGLATGFGAELGLDVPMPRTQAEKLIAARVGVPDPPGQHLLELTHELDPVADERYEALYELARERRLQVVATTAAHYHAPPRRPLATALAAVRARSSLDEMDGWLPAGSSAAGQHLRSGDEMAVRFARWPGVVEAAHRLGTEIAFPLKLIAPDLPPFPVPPGHDEMSYLRELTYRGHAEWFAGKPHAERARAMIEHELEIIEELHFPGYFLVVWEIAKFCRENGILAQGRGSAANSAVCYALRITAVDPVYYELMFERFLAPERGEPPDIDIDIESDRREEVIQHVYAMHGREHAAQVANVITYRPKSAVRDIAKALGYSQGQQDAWSKEIEQGYYWSSQTENDTKAIPPQVIALAGELQDSPRHLGIHSGGMVMCDRPVIEVCPVEWGRMPGRTVLQWDKDDCAEIGLVKFDLLGLGMLSAIQYCLTMIREFHGVMYELATIPRESPCVYDMLCDADSIGVFQVESRAQIATLPRLKPRCFYDLAIEVALIRPGPIQGGSVHPYIRRKNGDEPITFPHPRLEEPLKRTLGIPLFQEQLMQIAVHVADFTPSEADQLRRAMGSKRSKNKIEAMRIRLYDGMNANGITGAVADEIYEKIKAFAAFGFAESHSISFALLVYASSWLKRHYPAAFCAALLNAQPMGFYSPQSLVHDAKRHGIEVRKPLLSASLANASLEPGDGPSQCSCLDAPQPAVRLGLSSVRTIGADLAVAIVESRERDGMFTSMADLARRVGMSADQVEALATSGAFDCLDLPRREALWGAGAAATARPGQLDIEAFDEAPPPGIPTMTEPEQ